jgi:N-acyl homoserine lactone hydrolase
MNDIHSYQENTMPLSRLTRRSLIGAGAIALPAAVGTGWLAFMPGPSLGVAPPVPDPKSFDLGGGMRLHLIQTGWVAVKSAHRRFAGPDALRLPAIIGDPRWTEWLPITCWIIEHPEGMIAVDTGETAAMHQPDYLACDPAAAWFYGRNLRFALTPDTEVGPQMRTIGLNPQDVTRVIMTHLHSDHIGGLHWFEQAQFLISATDRNGHQGAVMCLIPTGMNRQSVQPEAGQLGAFDSSLSLTGDGAIVSTPGHTPGHQSVMLHTNAGFWLIGGDAAFSQSQVLDSEMAGIVEDPAAARDTLAQIKDQLRRYPTVFLPSHDPDNATRLAAGPQLTAAV